MTLTFTVQGKPIPQPRSRSAAGKRPYVAAAHAVHRWKAEVYIACYEEIIRRGWQKIPFREKVSVAIVLWGLRANADLDNAFKSIADALNGCAYYDDSQIAKLTVERRPADKAHPPGAIIEIEEIA